MRYLLDTNVVTRLYDKSAQFHAEILQRLALLTDQDEVAISILTLYELEYGRANAPANKRELVGKKIEEAQRDFSICPLTTAGARMFGTLKRKLRKQRSLSQKGIQRHSVDLILAATCITDQRRLISSDSIFNELSRLEPRLTVEDWADPT